MSGARVAIIGAGLSGTAMAIHALRDGAAGAVLIERALTPGRGVAYGTARPEHLLNVTARRMSVFPDDPDHFARWLAARGGGENDYAPRRTFGDYAEALLAASGAEMVRGEAVAIEDAGGRECVRLADGRSIEADVAVLALGNLKPAVPAPLDPAALGPLFVGDPWFGGVAEGLGPESTVLLVGTGLTAIDAALTLDAEGFKGRILALSRRGLAPRANLPRDPVVEPPGDYPLSAAALLRTVRARARRIGWREAVHEVRHKVQAIWGAAPVEERRRFVRHLRPWWDVHRHRIAPAVAERIAALEAEGRLAFAAGRILSAEADGARARVRWRPRGSDRAATLEPARIVNCTGPEVDIARAGEPLLDALLAAGRIAPDACRIGVHVDPASRTVAPDGAASDSLYAIGPLTRGAFWETIAVADIAVQAQAVARRIAALRAAG